MSMQMAIGKERFKYYSVFVFTAAFFLPIGALKLHKPQIMAPLFPMAIAWTFQYDMYYGNLLLRAQKEASRQMKEEPERYFMPEGNGIVD